MIIVKPPKISVILPVYNAEKYIEEAIESIIEQSFTDFELIIINDGSTDNSLHIINTITDNRIVIINQENKFKHYGKSVKRLIDVAISIEDKDEQKALTGVILNLMKKTYLTFNQNSVDDNLILTDLKIISKDKLSSPEGFQMISTNEVLAMTKKKNTHSNKNHKNHKNNKQSNYKKRRY